MSRENIILIISGILFVVLSLIIIGKMTYINIVYGKEMTEVVDSIAYKNITVVGNGGNLYSADGQSLWAYSYPTFTIRWDAKVAKNYIDRLVENNDTAALSFHNIENLIYYLDSNFIYKNNNKSYRDVITDAYNNSKQYTLIASDVTFDELKVFKTFPFFSKHKYNGGMILETNFGMNYTNEKVGIRTIGKNDYTDDKNEVGIIGAYKDVLKGETKQLYTVKSVNTYRPVDLGKDFIALKGRDIVTTLDYNISEITYNALLKQLQKSNAKKGCAIVMDVKTGDIKSMVSLTQSTKNPMNYYDDFNVAISYIHEPGSVFKLASFLVALNDGVITLDDPVYVGNGVMNLSGKTIRDSHVINSTISAREVFSESSNVGTAKIIYDNYINNQQKYIDGLKALRLGEKVGLEILGEGTPEIKDTKEKAVGKAKDKWWKMSLVQMSYGYEVLLAPIHIATFYNTVANNGVMLKPRLIKEIKGNKKNDPIVFPITVVDTICSPYVAAQAHDILRYVVTNGTGRRAFKGAQYNFSGKTGTAQIMASKRYNTTFVGFFPSENPLYTIYVLISEPTTGGYYAASVSAPVVREIADKISGIDDRIFQTIYVDKNNINSSNLNKYIDNKADIGNKVNIDNNSNLSKVAIN